MTLVARDLTVDVAASKTEAHLASSLPGLRKTSLYGAAFKRVLDLVLLIASLPIWMPVIVLGALLVALDGHNPIYRQKRIGRGGEVFWLWKLRTMVVDADAKLETYLQANPNARAEWDAYQKLARDPRITLVGCILRKTSLDELPQLINVLKGDMSLVGPRPMMVSQKLLYPGESYYELRPGLTGLWQVSDRNKSTFADRARFDDAYAATLSFGADLSILARTVLVVLRGTGI